MMTGYTVQKHTISKEHVDDIIEKPFDQNLLDKKIHAYLKRTG
jgi:DNA-binding response OmpR family regulator